LRQLLARLRLASSLFAFCAAPPPAAPPLIFCARDFWKASAFHIIPQTESAKMVEIGRFQAQNFRFHQFFGSRQAKRENETKPKHSPAETAGFSFPAPL